MPRDLVVEAVAAKDKTKDLISNFCRNPDGETGIWCYTTTACPEDNLTCDTRFDYCDPIEKPAPLALTTDVTTTVPESYAGEKVADSTRWGSDPIWTEKGLGIDGCAKRVTEDERCAKVGDDKVFTYAPLTKSDNGDGTGDDNCGCPKAGDVGTETNNVG